LFLDFLDFYVFTLTYQFQSFYMFLARMTVEGKSFEKKKIFEKYSLIYVDIPQI